MNAVRMALFCLLLAGCTATIVPKTPSVREASWDQNIQNSGFIGFDQVGNGILTPHAHDRYNALVAVYGSRLSPPAHTDDGITVTATNTFLIDAQHLDYFGTMQRWKREGQPAK